MKMCKNFITCNEFCILSWKFKTLFKMNVGSNGFKILKHYGKPFNFSQHKHNFKSTVLKELTSKDMSHLMQKIHFWKSMFGQKTPNRTWKGKK